MSLQIETIKLSENETENQRLKLFRAMFLTSLCEDFSHTPTASELLNFDRQLVRHAECSSRFFLSNNGRSIAVGCGNCDRMLVDSDKISLERLDQSERLELLPRLNAETEKFRPVKN